MSAHIDTQNGNKAPKVVVCCDKGTVQLFDVMNNQVTVLSKLSQYTSWFMLGFGASGKELADKWTIKDDGPEAIDGINTEKLELTAKDPIVQKNIHSVTVWMDLDRAVSVKQIFDEGDGQTRTCTYTNIQVNHSLPGSAFKLDTNGKTKVVNQ
jgi:outer membrane lipoprotein-sorting protein